MPALNRDDTIAALSTPPGEGGIAVIRISGKESVALASRFFRPSKKTEIKSQPTHTIRHGHFTDEPGNVIDEVLVSLFRAPRSYTGEDVVEISCHGGHRLVQKILEILYRHGARAAAPGEFTQRAFLHGKLDLTQAEGVLDLIRSRSDAFLQASARLLQGGLSKKVNRLKEVLLKIIAHLEAEIDFPDERLEGMRREECLKGMKDAEEELGSLTASFGRGTRLREGVLTVIVGRANVGKSSLFNALLERDRALVSALPGTTRDALEEELEIGGRGLRIVDTAGLAAPPRDALDRLGMEKTRQYLAEGDLFLVLFDGSREWAPEDEEILDCVREKNTLFLINKTDLPQKLDVRELDSALKGGKPCFVSCLAGDGFAELEKRIEERTEAIDSPRESPALTRLRHKQAVENSLEALREAIQGFEEGVSPELVLIDLKSSVDCLKELIGEIYSEDLLDVIFREFCIGK